MILERDLSYYLVDAKMVYFTTGNRYCVVLLYTNLSAQMIHWSRFPTLTNVITNDYITNLTAYLMIEFNSSIPVAIVLGKYFFIFSVCYR